VRSAIENTIARYAWLFDGNEIDALGGCFTQDAAFQIGAEPAVHGREGVVAELRRRRQRYERSGAVPWHHVSTIEIVVADALAASVRSRFALTVVEADGQARLASVGWYDDELACITGRWLIHRRRVGRPGDG
jgi:hypothetical protein